MRLNQWKGKENKSEHLFIIFSVKLTIDSLLYLMETDLVLSFHCLISVSTLVLCLDVHLRSGLAFLCSCDIGCLSSFLVVCSTPLSTFLSHGRSLDTLGLHCSTCHARFSGAFFFLGSFLFTLSVNITASYYTCYLVWLIAHPHVMDFCFICFAVHRHATYLHILAYLLAYSAIIFLQLARQGYDV